MPRFPTLEGDQKTDVLVIGGGLAGLLCAHRLTQAGVDCTLMEENRLLSGVSGRTTAKVTAQHGLIYGKLFRKFGPERTRMYWQANEEALSAFRKLAKAGDFAFESQNNYLFQRNGTDILERERTIYQRLGLPFLWDDAPPLPFPAAALGFPNQAQIHPIKLAAHLCRGLKIYENTKALAFLGDRVQTPRGAVMANNILVATHFPLWNKHGAYFLKLYQQRSYVIALENAGNVDGMYLDCAENGLSIRSAGPWLLLGGGGHRTGKQGLGWSIPESAAARYWPGAKTVARWATQDCMTLDGMPYIGQYSPTTPNLYVATGFQKWGMTGAMLSALILTDQILGKENPYGDLFSPSRSMFCKQLLCNGLESAVNLLRPTVPRCPHLGCALRWNKTEHSWDCPCHGSRFDPDGNLLNNPATDGLKQPPFRVEN